MNINLYQRLVLVAGATGVMLVVFNVGMEQRYGSAQWDWKAAITETALVAITTAAVFFAVGPRKKS